MRKLIDQVDDDIFLAKLAVYARERAYMKDMPAALLVVLSKRDTELLHCVFDRVVDIRHLNVLQRDPDKMVDDSSDVA